MNLWQYVVLLEGLGAVATSVGLAHESLRRRDPVLKLVGYANLGVALISLSVCATVTETLDAKPTTATWLAGVGFAVYALAAASAWVRARWRALDVDAAYPSV